VVNVFRTLVGVVLLVLVSACPAWAQEVAGSQLSGVVRDSSTAGVPGAEVTVTKTDTGLTRTVFTGAEGAYAIPNLPVGPYQLKVVLQGFNTYVRDGIVLQVGSNPEINVTLTIGAISEQIIVTANSTLVETRNTGVGQVIDNQRLMEMPLERPILGRAHLSVRAGDDGSGGRSEHEQELPDRRRSRWPAARPNGITFIMDGGHAQRSVQQPQSADAVSRRAAGVQGRDERAAGTLRSSRGLGRQRGHQVGDQRAARQSVRVRATLPLQCEELFRADQGQSEPQPVRWHARRPDQEEQDVRVRRVSGRIERSDPATTDQLRADAGDVERRLSPQVTAPECNAKPSITLDRAPLPEAGNRIDPSRFSSVSAQFSQTRAGVDRSLRAAAVRHPNNSTEHQGSARSTTRSIQRQTSVRPLLLRGVRQSRPPTTGRTC
jgi:hypothetical protein